MSKSPNGFKTTTDGKNTLIFSYEIGKGWVVMVEYFDDLWNATSNDAPFVADKDVAETAIASRLGRPVNLV